MKIIHRSAASITIELSRANLQALLAKLDGHPPDTSCVLLRYDASAQCYLRVHAVENSEHYLHRDRGIMHEDTERAIEDMRTDWNAHACDLTGGINDTHNPNWCKGCTPDPEVSPGEACSGCGPVYRYDPDADPAPSSSVSMRLP